MYNSNDQIKENNMCSASDGHGDQRNMYRVVVGKQRKEANRKTDIGGWIILKWCLEL
jgi:hypothetical protein